MSRFLRLALACLILLGAGSQIQAKAERVFYDANMLMQACRSAVYYDESEILQGKEITTRYSKMASDLGISCPSSSANFEAFCDALIKSTYDFFTTNKNFNGAYVLDRFKSNVDAQYNLFYGQTSPLRAINRADQDVYLNFMTAKIILLRLLLALVECAKIEKSRRIGPGLTGFNYQNGPGQYFEGFAIEELNQIVIVNDQSKPLYKCGIISTIFQKGGGLSGRYILVDDWQIGEFIGAIGQCLQPIFQLPPRSPRPISPQRAVSPLRRPSVSPTRSISPIRRSSPSTPRSPLTFGLTQRGPSSWQLIDIVNKRMRQGEPGVIGFYRNLATQLGIDVPATPTNLEKLIDGLIENTKSEANKIVDQIYSIHLATVNQNYEILKFFESQVINSPGKRLALIRAKMILLEHLFALIGSSRGMDQFLLSDANEYNEAIGTFTMYIRGALEETFERLITDEQRILLKRFNSNPFGPLFGQLRSQSLPPLIEKAFSPGTPRTPTTNSSFSSPSFSPSSSLSPVRRPSSPVRRSSVGPRQRSILPVRRSSTIRPPSPTSSQGAISGQREIQPAAPGLVKVSWQGLLTDSLGRIPPIDGYGARDYAEAIRFYKELADRLGLDTSFIQPSEAKLDLETVCDLLIDCAYKFLTTNQRFAKASACKFIGVIQAHKQIFADKDASLSQSAYKKDKKLSLLRAKMILLDLILIMIDCAKIETSGGFRYGLSGFNYQNGPGQYFDGLSPTELNKKISVDGKHKYLYQCGIVSTIFFRLNPRTKGQYVLVNDEFISQYIKAIGQLLIKIVPAEQRLSSSSSFPLSSESSPTSKRPLSPKTPYYSSSSVSTPTSSLLVMPKSPTQRSKSPQRPPRLASPRRSPSRVSSRSSSPVVVSPVSPRSARPSSPVDSDFELIDMPLELQPKSPPSSSSSSSVRRPSPGPKAAPKKAAVPQVSPYLQYSGGPSFSTGGQNYFQ